MATTIKDENGNLLWQPNDFGLYSNMKTEVIAQILAELLTDTMIQVETHSGDAPITNVYTKEESDARFFQIALFPAYLDGQIYRLIAEGQIIGISDLNLINSRLLLLYMSCFGTDLDGHRVQQGFDVRIQSLEDMSDFLFSRVTQISRDIYLVRDGVVDPTVLVIAKLADTGYRENLSPTIADTSTMVAAINSVNSEVKDNIDAIGALGTRVDDLETQNGSATLTTTAQTLSDAINELDGELGTAQTDIGNLQTDVGNAQGDITSINTAVGDVSTLDSGFTSQEVVAALNQLISSVNTLSGQISALDTRVTALENNP